MQHGPTSVNRLGSCNAACGRYRRGHQNGSLGRGAGHPSAELSLGSRGVMNRRTLSAMFSRSRSSSGKDKSSALSIASVQRLLRLPRQAAHPCGAAALMYSPGDSRSGDIRCGVAGNVELRFV